jgi:integral membrane protein (TIGR01906 family)
MKTNRTLSVIFALALVLFLLTAAISLPIYGRGFYYAHIEAMDLPGRTGRSAEEIRAAYDEVLDYLTKPNREFGTGVFPHSEEGAAHFADCKVLFDLNRNVLLLSGAALLVLLLLRKLKKTDPYRLGKKSAAFWAAVAAVVLPIVLGGLAALNFDRAFVVFHTIFFPGKSNWVFDWYRDAIIQALPQDFFMHCAMLIGGGLLLFSAAVLGLDFLWEKKSKES